MFLSWWRQLVSWVNRRALMTRKQRREFKIKRFPRAAWGCLTLEMLESREAPAVDIWTGLSVANVNWNDPANWSTPNPGGIPVAGDDIVFPASAITGPRLSNNNLTVGTSFNSITFQAGGFLVTGNALALGAGGISNTGSNVFGPALTLGTGVSINSLSGTLSLTGTVAQGANPFTVTGPGNTFFASTAAVSGSVPAGTTALTKSGAGKLTLAGADTYTGVTAVSQGILNIQNNTGLGAVGAGNETTIANGAALQLQGAQVGAGLTAVAEAITQVLGSGVNGAGAIENVNGNNTMTGAVALTGNVVIGSDANTLTMTGVISDGGANSSVTKVGAGTQSRVDGQQHVRRRRHPERRSVDGGSNNQPLGRCADAQRRHVPGRRRHEPLPIRSTSPGPSHSAARTPRRDSP